MPLKLPKAEKQPESNRIGWFYLHFEPARTLPVFYASVFAAMQFFPLRCDMQAERMMFYYAGYSPRFDELEKGAVIPQYDLQISLKDSDDDAPQLDSVTVVRMDE